jgi:hypothetical protein
LMSRKNKVTAVEDEQETEKFFLNR